MQAWFKGISTHFYQMFQRRNVIEFVLSLATAAIFQTALCPCGVHAKYSEGTLVSQDNWHFLERFCFMSDDGKLEYDVRYPMSYGVQNMYLYYDSAEQWPAVYKTSKTCLEKESVLRRDYLQIINLTLSTLIDEYSWPGCDVFNKNGAQWYKCQGYKKFNSMRERWWYIAVGNCNTTQGLYLDYKLTLTNSHPGDIWFYHFSADEFYILPVDIAFLLAELLQLVVAFSVAIILRARQMFHVTYKVFILSLVLEVLGLFCACIANGDYAQTGVGFRFFKLQAEIYRVSSVLIFQLTLILLAKGYTVTRGRLSKKGSTKIVVFMSVYTIAYAGMFIYQSRVFDPGEVLYKYQSPPGYSLIGLRLLGWAWFMYAAYFTIVHYPEKRAFYLPFIATYSWWFWMGPGTIIVANLVLTNWMRAKIVNAVEDSVAFMGYSAFLYITRPSATNENFPYHVRTSQIGVLVAKDTTGGAVNLPHHTYGVSPADCASAREDSGRNYDMFTTSSSGAVQNGGGSFAVVRWPEQNGNAPSAAHPTELATTTPSRATASNGYQANIQNDVIVEEPLSDRKP